MKTKDVSTALRRHGCTPVEGGRHTIWTCPCRNHKAHQIGRHNQSSPGVVKDTMGKMACLPKGWLQ